MGPQDAMYLIADCSGSMQELGKALLTRNITGFIREFLNMHGGSFFCSGIQLYLWNECVTPFRLNDDCEIPHMVTSGKADLKQLRDFLEKELLEQNHVKAIILSDGNFPKNELINFGNWCKEQPCLKLIAVAVGSDASLSGLKELSSDGRIFNPEDIATAIKSVFSKINLRMQGPASVNDLVEPPFINEEVLLES